MQIDWFTVAAQAFNFILLAVLLWFVLYRPIRGAVDRREEEIESRIEEARKEKEEAEALKEEHRRKEAELEEKRDSLVQEVQEEAEERRQELRQQIKEEMEKTREEWQDSLRRDRESFLAELSDRTRDEVFLLVRKGLEDLVEAQPEEAFLETFLRRLRQAPDEEREAFAQALDDAGNTFRLRTALEIPEEGPDRVRDEIQGWLEEREAEASVGVEVEVEEDGPRGIEIWAGNRKLAWTVEAYVDGLREAVHRVLESEMGEEQENEEEKAEEAEEEEEA